MLDMFQKKGERPNDVKTIRDSLLRFIKEQLQKLEGGEGSNIKALQVFLSPSEEEKHLYDAALYLEEENRFKNEEVQKIADDYAIDLPKDWAMEIEFVETPPAEAIKAPDINAALFIQTRKHSLHKTSTAYIKIISGEAEKDSYRIESADGRFNLGREKQVQAEGGFFRTNHIAFPSSSKNEHNKFISRQHAHIEYNNETGCFVLFADEGGIPPRNKVKVLTKGEEMPVKLLSTKVGHSLEEGDQVMLGESAVVEFTYNDI